MLMHSELSNPFDLTRRQTAGVQGACPNGGKWYSCSESGFVGCCTVNACTSVGCAAGNVRAASLGDIPYGSVPDQACLTGGQFFTCTGPPPFWGCCKSVPCGTGCPQADLAPASLAQTPNNPFASEASPNPTASSTSPPSSSGGSSTPTGAIVGGVVGGILGLALIGILIWWLLRRNKTKKEVAPPTPMAYNPHSQQADPGSNVPLTYPEVVDHYATTSPAPTKQAFPPSAFQSPALPQYSDRRQSHELGGGGYGHNQGYDNSGPISPAMGSPGFQNQHNYASRPMSYELHGTGSPSMGGMPAPSIMSTAVSELPADTGDMRFSRVSSNLGYGNQPASPGHPSNDASGTGLGVTMSGQAGERAEK